MCDKYYITSYIVGIKIKMINNVWCVYGEIT